MVPLSCRTAADVTRVTVLLFPLAYSSLRKYMPAAFSLFEQTSLKIKFSIIKISSKIIVSLSFLCHLYTYTYCEMINSVMLVSGRTALNKKASYVLI